MTWTGDNSSTWNHLRQTTPQLVNLGLSGFAMAGADVGGFAGSPQPDLLTRWLEVAAFHPIDRDHTAIGTNPQEPWENGTPDDVNLRRRYIEERYRLCPTSTRRRGDEPYRAADHAAALSGISQGRRWMASRWTSDGNQFLLGPRSAGGAKPVPG